MLLKRSEGQLSGLRPECNGSIPDRKVQKKTPQKPTNKQEEKASEANADKQRIKKELKQNSIQ